MDTRTRRAVLARLGALEARASCPPRLDGPPPITLPDNPGEALRALFVVKLEASRALADGCRELLRDPRWVARQTPAGLAALAAWLDSSALQLGDRLAARRREGADHA